MAKRPCVFLVLLAMLLVCSCENKSERDQATSMSTPNTEIRQVFFSKIRESATSGVDKAKMRLALEGDPGVALELASGFSDRNKLDEAIFWYQISAENGNSIAMQHLSVYLRDMDCVRANYWLRRYVESLPKESAERSSSAQVLAVHEKECGLAASQSVL